MRIPEADLNLMAVVCKNKKSLRECFSSLDSNSRDEYKFFKAICRSLDYDEVRSFYGMYVPNDKVTTTFDSVSAEALREKFPFTDFTTIEKVRTCTEQRVYLQYFTDNFIS